MIANVGNTECMIFNVSGITLDASIFDYQSQELEAVKRFNYLGFV